jgi:hypothetical protein
VSHPTDTSLVFGDLHDALAALEVARGSPNEVRRAFSRYVDLTQRLTSAMRKDFSRLKQEKWAASSFAGWNNVTAFFKWLRNEDQHAAPIYISVLERHFYRISPEQEQLFVFEGTWVLNDQMTEAPPDGITLRPADPVTGGMSEVIVEPVRVEHQYLLQPRTQEAQAQMQLAGTSDVHQLSNACFIVLREYHEHFKRATGA